MAKDFEIVVEGEFPAEPDAVWTAITERESAWLFPTDGMPGVDLVNERPTHHVNRMEGPDGWFNQLEQVITPVEGGRSFMRWVHSGVIVDDWDNQYDAASKHTVFYLHTLAQYLQYFAPRAAVFADVQGPEASSSAGAFEVLRESLGLDATGQVVTTELPDGTPADVDFSNEHFIGLRTADALYRFFGRNAFGATVGMTIHHFGGADADELQSTWKAWLDGLYAKQ